MKKRIIAATLAIAMLLGAVGCSKNAGNEMQREEGESVSAEKESPNTKKSVTAYVGTSIFESSLDPVKGSMSYGYPFICEALLKVNPDSEYTGDLATDWKMSEDARTYTFTLREGVKFSDGSDFTAEDVVFTYETVMKNQGGNENVDLSRLESVRAMDDKTVEFHLKEPYSPFLDTAAMLQIVPSDGYDQETFDQYPIGTGAYKMVQYDTNQQMILEANENYSGKKPDIEKITLVYMDSDAAFAAAQSGQLDIVMVSTSYAGEKLDGMTLQRFETMDVRNISLPVNKEQTMTSQAGEEVVAGNNVTCDKAVREALSIGIDRQAIIDKAFNGIGKPAVSFTDNLLWANTEECKDGRVEEAIRILENAGWKDSNGDGVREKGDLECSFDVYALGGDQDRFQLGSALAEDAAKLGIQINMKTSTWDEAAKLQNSNGIVWGWGQYSPTVLDSMYNSARFLGGGYDDPAGLQSDAVDTKIAEAIGARTQEEAIAAWKEVQKLADAEYTNLFLVNIEHAYFIKDTLDISMDTQIPHPHGHGSPIVCNMADWTWK